MIKNSVIKKWISLALLSVTTTAFASESSSLSTMPHSYIGLQKQTGFFRFSFDNIKMPNNIDNMGLMGVSYFADITPIVYAGVGGYGSVSGTQGGLFVLAFGGGLHKEFLQHICGDVGFDVGGGGGHSSLVGGGLMIRPHIGLEYDLRWARLGLHYSYINFTSGLIHSQQIGLDLDLPCNFYYVPYAEIQEGLFTASQVHLFDGKFLDFQRNDFGLILQAYNQHSGTKNTNGEIQDGTISLVGAELDHYITQNGFWWIKASGAYHGIPNGYMDVLGGLGYHWALWPHGLAIVPQMGAGAGGGGNVDTGGGVVVQPSVGVEIPLSSSFAARLNGGYLWAPKGQLSAYTATGEILYHLDFAKGSDKPVKLWTDQFDIRDWRIQLFNQSYIHPQRTYHSTIAVANLIALQFDQLFTPHFFFSYQAASAYSGDHMGGYATGMIGPGLQTSPFLNQRMQLFGEVLVGAGGGGGLALGGGALIEPVLGVYYAMTPSIGLQASMSDVKAINDNLNTPVFNVGLTVRFGLLSPDE